MKKIFLSVCLIAVCSAICEAQPKLRADNVEEVLSAMTLEEKATLLVGSGWGVMVGGLTGSDESLVPGAAGTTRAIARLGIPQTVMADGPAGLRIKPVRSDTEQTFYCTAFPVGTSLASTWNLSLVQGLAAAMGNEVKEYGVDVLLAPGMNLHRNPLCGRNFEYFSEDPLLSGKMAAAYVNGIQSNGVGVSVKHFAANNQETNRMRNDSRMDVRSLRELYLKGFEIAVKESHPWTVMSSYNKINGVFTQYSRELLDTILRREWGFDGIVMTDWIGPRRTVRQISAINDLLMPGMDSIVDDIVIAVNQGKLDICDVDECVRNMLNYIVKTPRFQGYKYSNSPDLDAHADLVRKSTPEALVLLENRNALPLCGVKKVALYGVGSYDFIAGGTGSGNVNKKVVHDIAEGLRINGIEIDADIEHWYRQHILLRKMDMKNGKIPSGSALGTPVVDEMEIPASFIDSKVPESDIAILTISRNAGEGNDRKDTDGDFELTPLERTLLRQLCESYHRSGKKVIVVLNIGGVIETASWKHMPDAVLLAWTPGQEGGIAVGDVLAGKAYPSGKLPMTFPMSYFDIPSSAHFPYNYEGGRFVNPFGTDDDTENMSLEAMLGRNLPQVENVEYTDYAEGIWVGYRYFRTFGREESYPFGYGLSYTSFIYDKPMVKREKDGTVRASIRVTNSGTAPGKEIVQVYVSAPDGGLEKPVYELRAFGKTKELAPGESEVLTMTFDNYALASFNENNSAWEMADGVYTVHFGASASDLRCSAKFKVTSPLSWQVNRVMLPR